ncbi:bifunctional 23S rRNA (guanine(2069)-N(7))-methyltransferase RlmK/23S rRNA (guanine(2445)-N(2))-methyltransferase RlmL [Reinekea marinisedimentorum]|uniref:Ribosomal RNA large subunit methyltransferase K/L n=1 Tax=Reinekea marinisedimentorum TaxID=230495 RepID=A0A4R3I8X7_9GAMM|nr:bifunctional 23S rRNA (guanine(2069)-N(7))-methyltransferase RlmK/23S rRNA (guanine(2445)-N(2))-methyltransferase RlmL [Reinekea marinisedimentorum]TCS42594.1 23S rRNA (guanine2445-N2)-methyltransferase / 23S rRNA (guanine2069-N7)-methyltransferase [Reinekea marinisedimentorum]
MNPEQTYRFWVTCPQGVHGLLKQEITQIAEVEVGDWHKGVTFSGSLADAYRVCLWSRLSNRVYLALGETSEVSFDELQRLVTSVQWDEHLRPTGTLRVKFSGHLPEIRDTRFGAQKVKDWVVDQIRDKHGSRPNVDAKSPDVSIFAQVARKKMFVGLEFTSESLHKRGYRQFTGPAPIKENLASALLMAAGWPEMAKERKSFFDLMCGSGTLVVEAAMIAADYAPGLGRVEYAFERWLQHDNVAWQLLLREARQRREKGIETMPAVIGYDADGGVIAAANETLDSLGLSKQVRCYHKSLDEWEMPTHRPVKPGLWLSNPPYGERLGDKPLLLKTYRKIGELAREKLADWRIGILTSDDVLAREVGLRPYDKKRFHNGPLETTLYLYDAGEDRAASAESSTKTNEQVQGFKNRITKNLKQLKKWQQKEGIEAYRIYDADIPEFAVAVDKYGDWLHVQEYAPPKTIPVQKAEQRLMLALEALSDMFEMPVSRIAVKRRERQRGQSQYERNASQGQFFEVTEHGVKLKVNLFDYLDTGLFLDHRNSRQWVQQNCNGKRVLNLFCYTAAFTSHAFVGKAVKTVSVDLSKTYLKWGRDNLKLNGGKEGPSHQFIHADCMQWLADCKDSFDIIVLDPPTFSNSARMKDTLDVQRDHEFLVNSAMNCLTAEGVLIFSNNYKRFHMADSLYEKYDVKDITNRSVPLDFKRSKPHRCFEVRHKFSG